MKAKTPKPSKEARLDEAARILELAILCESVHADGVEYYLDMAVQCERWAAR